MLRRPLTALALACALAHASPAAAQPDQKTEAIKHFDDGVKLRDKGDCVGAIKEFLEVLKHDESVGAQLNLGACYDATKDYRRAVDAYEQAAVIARRKGDERSVDAKEAAKRIRKDHPWIILVVGRDVAALDGLEIKVDDVPVIKDDYGGEVFPRRSGRHTVVVTTRDREATYTVNDKETAEVRLENLRPKASGDHVTPPAPPPPPPGDDDHGGGWGWQKWTGVGVFGAGVVVGVVGLLTFTREAISKHADAHDAADAAAACEKQVNATPPTKKQSECDGLITTQNNAITDFNNNHTVEKQLDYIIPAGVLMIGGAVLFLLAPSGSSSEPSSATIHVVPTLGGGMVVGTF